MFGDRLPIAVFVDSDPDGARIFQTYRDGGQSSKLPVKLPTAVAKMLYLGKKVELELVTQHRSTLLDYIGDVLGDRSCWL
ncbi:hypothetical protein DL89DRAFT_289834 [Linderina pennispora]|uniref:Toprim domain-containing protein n=1 Tax=Linderina pennispora TaxID=61395 RepID=A0A1Y1WM02_9FUNG|nr:uncharacterized protein DL89DRAFT_289834 [Linderina pennispora]ORX74226.1 hypothetical protein DL89DRAFT_289834 [Linderina pennispora]